jgi:hypothetical protein
MVRRVYAHLGTVRHQSEVVEYRVGQHFGEGAAEGKDNPRDTEVSTGEDLPEWARRDSNARPLAPEASPIRTRKAELPNQSGHPPRDPRVSRTSMSEYVRPRTATVLRPILRRNSPTLLATSIPRGSLGL